MVNSVLIMNDFLITVADSAEKINIEIIDIDIIYAVNDIPCLKLRLVESYLNENKFTLSTKKIFVPGKEITVASSDEKVTLFKGIITGLSVGYAEDYYLDVIARGDVIKMTEGLSTQLFGAGDDVSIIKKILKDNKIKVDKYPPKSIKQNQFFCYQASPWKVMMERILANGFSFVARPTKNEIIDLTKYSPKKASIKLNNSEVRSFKFDMDARSQIKAIIANSWSIKEQKIDKGTKGEVGKYKVFKDADKVMNTPEMALLSNIPKAPDELKAIVSAQNNYRLLDLYQGEITLVIHENSKLPYIELMHKIKIEGAGEEFSGEYMVTSIRHRTVNNQWLMDLELGLPLARTLNSPYAHSLPLPNLIGKVLGYKLDEKEKLERIPIKLPMIGDKEIWARLLSPYASKGEGLFFPPNEGDEVIVGFIEGDCRYPVILGSCHSPVNTPPIPFTKKNEVKGLYAKSKDLPFNLIIDGAKKSLELAVGEECKVVLSDEKGASLAKGDSSLAIGDKVEIVSKDVMTLTTDKDINIKASGKVIVTAQVTEVK
jgi:type VI secretion system secreted protein VgrG